MITDYISVDVETTGLNPKEERIIEIGAVKVSQGKIIDTFQSFLKPGRALEERIVTLTGITDQMLANAPQPQEVIRSFHLFCGTLPLLGHQIGFDYSFLKRAMVNERLPFEKMGLDTLKIARLYLPELESRSLVYLCQYYGIAHEAHRALGDAMAAHILYQKLCEAFYERAEREASGVFSLKPLICHVKREQAITIAQKEQIKRYCERLDIRLDREIQSMTRSEASRFIEKYRIAYKQKES